MKNREHAQIKELYENAKGSVMSLLQTAIDDDLVDPTIAIHYRNYASLIDSTFWNVFVLVASADGPIDRREADYLNTMFGMHGSAYDYNTRFVSLASRNGAKDNLKTIFETMFRVNLTNSFALEAYDPTSEPLIAVFELLAAGLIASGNVQDINEISKLSEFTELVHGRAAIARRKMERVTAKPVKVKAKQKSGKASIDRKMRAGVVSDNNADPGNIDGCIAELHALVGLATVKREVENLINLAKVFALRKERGMQVPAVSFHLIFSGNPGTGKTTVARIISKVYSELGLLSGSKFVEVDRSGLVANYVGQTATKTTDVLNSAMGGVLFIDEAYSLVKGGDNDFGSEAIEVILKRMEDSRDDLVVIAAGYSANMQEFLRSNPGLRSRFPRVIEFPDYTPLEMAEIYERMAISSGYKLSEDAKSTSHIEVEKIWLQRGEDFANARDVRNLFERTLSAHANRISYSASINDDILSFITGTDVQAAAE